MTQGPGLGLKLALAAFFVAILLPLVPLLNLVFAVLAALSVASLGRARRASGGGAFEAVGGVVLLIAGIVGLVLASGLAAQAAERGAEQPPLSVVASQLAAEVAVAAAFYISPLAFMRDRARLLLGLGLGASLAVSAMAAYAALYAPDTLASALLAKGLPWILFAWAYATAYGTLKRTEETPEDRSIDRNP
jgi:hypothetical protein